MKRIIFTSLFFFTAYLLSAQCTVNVSSNPMEITCGQSASLSAFGSSTGQLVLDEDFNTSNFGPGWSSTPGATNFSNPCSPGGVDGTPHAWMDNNTSVPRTLKSASYDLSMATAGVTICFDMLFATQGDAAPCEGPDEPDEGVFLQYSTDGGTTWVTIHYFDPNGGNDPMLTNWNNWCFQVPAVAITSNTMFQWHQTADSGADYDHWGIDNVQIFMNDVNSQITWLHDGYSYGLGNPGGVNPTPVTPTSTTTYTAQMVTGTGSICTADITVIVNPPVYDVTVSANPTTICSGDCSTITGTGQIILDPGGIETYENNEFDLVASGNASVNINVQGINTSSISSGLIENVTINGFSFSGSYLCTSFGGCNCNGTPIGFGSTCNLDASGFTVTLTSPGGCTMVLAPAGVATGNYSNTVFVPVGGSVFGPGFPNGGTWNPQDPFSNMNGCDPNGVWTLSFDAPGLGFGIGTLFGWSITFNDPPIYQPVNFSWSPSTGLSNPNDINTQACPTTSTDYVLTVDNGTPGCPVYTETVSIIVDPCGGCTPPNLIISPLSVCSPLTVDLNTAIGAGSDPATLSFHATNLDAQNDVNPIGATVATSGSYWVRAEDPADPTCFLVYEVVVTVNSLNYSAISTEENCGQADGSISISPLGGSPVYSYSIDNGITFQGSGSFNGLSAGPYQIIVSDGNGCQVTGNEVVGSIGGPTISSISITDPSCQGVCDGEITITVTGGTAPYSYQWYDVSGNPIGTNAPTINGLCAADYSVEVNDAGGSGTQLNTNSDFELGLGGGCNCATGYNCGNDAGQVFDGSNPVYAVGNQGCVTVATNYTNSLGAYSGTGYIYFYAGADNIMSQSYPFVGGEQVELCVMYAGPQGAGPPGQNTAASHFSFGVDGAQVGPDVPVPTNTGWTQFCFTVTMTAGNHTFSILSGGAAQYSLWFDDFTITVQGSGGSSCPANANMTLIDPLASDPSFTLTDFCVGSPNSASLIGTPGGTFTFNPDPLDGSSVNSSTGEITTAVSGTTYNIEYTTPGSCPATQTNSVTANGFTISSITTDEFCGNSDGSISINTVSGGPLFTYSIDNGVSSQGTSLFSGLSAGTYTLLVTDQATLCTATGSAFVGSAGGPTIDVMTIIDESCAGMNDGSIDVNTVTGGSGTYDYSWSLVPDPGTSSVSNLPAGIYTVTVTDPASGCATDSTITVNAGANCCDLEIDALQTINILCNHGSDGEIEVLITGGTGPFTFELSDGTNLSTNSTGVFTSLLAGTYSISVVDQNNCQVDTTLTLTEPDALQMTIQTSDPTCAGYSDGSIDISIIGGVPSYNYSIDNGVSWSTTNTFSSLPAGSYDVLIEDANGCQLGAQVVSLATPQGISLSLTQSNETCFGLCDGEIQTAVSGGSTPYTFQLNGLTVSLPYSSLCPGNYVVSVTDANACELSASADIIAADELILDLLNVVNDGCTEVCDGSIEVNATNGLNYVLNPGTLTNTSGLFTGLCAGAYGITVFDQNDCVVSTSVLVAEAEEPTAYFNITPPFLTTFDTDMQVVNTSYNSDAYYWTISGPNSYDYSSNEESFNLTLPSDSGAYIVCLYAISYDGCTDTLCAPIVVREEFNLFVPNTFTPDGDEFNQGFRAYATAIDIYEYEMIVFNRWGQIVFETHDIEESWDGTYGGKIIQTGTYTWKIAIKSPYWDERKVFTGHVNMLK